MDLFNPFPGLRPFEADEEHLFFGREKETDELLRRLRASRFLAVVGTSGSGKSSLVRSGLIPSLQGGYLVGASSSWHMAVFRPGEDPLGNLAGALAHPDVLGLADEEFATTNRVLMEATLRRGPHGLVDAVRQARLPKDHNLLVLVDQFEELFRFRRNTHIAHSRDEAIAFVRTLLEAVDQAELPIYVALTMRSDFIGDCMDFPGLSEAVNGGLYLVSRMSRDALRSAITGPVAVGGGTIAPRLVHRVLNDLGDDQDQLPLVQHALMRTWEHWSRERGGDSLVRLKPDTTSESEPGKADEPKPIDIDDYDAVGTFSGALSKHAEEAYAESASAGLATVTRRIFQALTDTVTDPRGVRRPTAISELSAIAGASESDVIRVVEVFRRSGRSFLMPPPIVPLTSRSIVDLSHESLMRCWTRLIEWAGEERSAAEFYVRLSRAARWYEEGSGGLWRNPELELAEAWQKKNEPTSAWGRRYDEGFARALAFLTQSIEARHQKDLRLERERRAKLRRAQAAAAVLGVFLVVASSLAYLAWRESQRAEKNLDLARAAVDQSLSSVDRNPARVGADVPALDELRRDLLGKAQTFYTAFMREEPSSDALKRDVALAHVKIGHINRLLEKPAEAEKEYQDAIVRLRSLAAAAPGNSSLKASLADTYNWLGETLRPAPARAADAEIAYDTALGLQQALTTADPSNAEVRRQLARSHYNRGILRADRGHAAESEADFREAIAILESLPGGGRGAAAQELARAYNNLGTLLADDPKRSGDVRALWEKAIAIDEALVAAEPENREYKIELSTFCANLAPLLKEQGADAEADARSRQALMLVEDLARLAPSLTVTLADTHSLRGTILQTKNAIDADREFGEALDLFSGAADEPAVRGRADYQLRFGDLLVNLAAPATAERRALLARAIRAYVTLTEKISAKGSRAEKQASLDTITRILPSLSQSDRDVLAAASRQLSTSLGDSR